MRLDLRIRRFVCIRLFGMKPCRIVKMDTKNVGHETTEVVFTYSIKAWATVEDVAKVRELELVKFIAYLERMLGGEWNVIQAHWECKHG